MTAQLDQILSSGSGGDIQVYSAPQDGIISSHIDGFEKITIDNFKTTSLAKADLNTTEHQSGEKITAKDPAYKLITSEDWSLLVELDKNTYKSLKDTTSIKTKIDKDNETLWADLSLLTKDGKYFACLTYNTSMIRLWKKNIMKFLRSIWSRAATAVHREFWYRLHPDPAMQRQNFRKSEPAISRILRIPVISIPLSLRKELFW